jgi:SAM-dependent methyltransferase
LRGRIGPSLGIDPLAKPHKGSNYQILTSFFTDPAPFPDASFDSIVLLATLEHIREKAPLARECFRLLRPGGRVIITVPSPAVDHIVHFLCRLRLLDGMSLDEHHGFDPGATAGVFGQCGFTLEFSRKFQFGLNHLFVFRMPASSGLNSGKVERSNEVAPVAELAEACKEPLHERALLLAENPLVRG